MDKDAEIQRLKLQIESTENAYRELEAKGKRCPTVLVTGLAKGESFSVLNWSTEHGIQIHIYHND